MRSAFWEVTLSIKVMSDVWEHSPASGGEILLLLAIADHCHDDGTGAWPSIHRLAQRTRQSERNTHRLVAKLAGMGELKIEPGGGRHNTNTYAIPLKGDKMSGLNPDKMSGFAGNPDNQGTETLTTRVRNPDIAMSPDPSVTIREPSVQSARFERPALEAMKLHAAKIGLPDTEAEKCWHYYESNGWRVGRNPMRSWQSAMINWRKNWQERGGVNGVARPLTPTDRKLLKEEIYHAKQEVNYLKGPELAEAQSRLTRLQNQLSTP